MFVRGYIFQASLIFLSKAGAYNRGAPYGDRTLWVGTLAYSKILDALAKTHQGDKRASLFRAAVSDDVKKSFFTAKPVQGPPEDPGAA